MHSEWVNVHFLHAATDGVAQSAVARPLAACRLARQLPAVRASRGLDMKIVPRILPLTPSNLQDQTFGHVGLWSSREVEYKPFRTKSDATSV